MIFNTNNMEAILKFNLPEEQAEFNTYNNVYKYYNCLQELKGYFRQQLKYEHEKLTDEQFQTIEQVSEKFYSILEENNINLND
jgi:hypothetical protein